MAREARVHALLDAESVAALGPEIREQSSATCILARWTPDTPLQALRTGGIGAASVAATGGLACGVLGRGRREPEAKAS
ncbi:hypothetical protein [Streptomyces sp. NPDC058092]|uniref:hypothetical protein n=1 Tax=Streptomyces sp. NPDC058092 TaxID=3346336 RepID=UPI0036E6F4C8